MKIMAQDFSFQRSGKDGKIVEGTFFYDADILDDETVNKIIQVNGIDMNNKIFTSEAPCFFLPKAQADLLRNVWVKQKVDEAVKGALTVTLE